MDDYGIAWKLKLNQYPLMRINKAKYNNGADIDDYKNHV